jgi:hypothetical protein
VEAKNDNFDEGWTQALLQSVVCKKLNNSVDIPILSIVTTGDTWQPKQIRKKPVYSASDCRRHSTYRRVIRNFKYAFFRMRKGNNLNVLSFFAG